MRYTQRANIDTAGINWHAVLPYGLDVYEIIDAAERVHKYLHEMNNSAIELGFSRFEETLLGNTFAGMLSELIVVAIGDASATLARNTRIGGHPDLVLAGEFDDDAVLRTEDGIEVKTSKQSHGWQGHNPEESWMMIFQYSIDVETHPVTDRFPTEIVKIMCAHMEERHWSFSGRNPGSRRTPTASILKEGAEILHASAVYERPGYVRNKNKLAEILHRAT